jgi:hypothetical protein
VNGDENLDLLITSSFSGSTLYLGNGQGGFEEASAGLTGVSDGATSIADVNRDGNPDLLITGFAGSSLSASATLYLGDGEGGFNEADAGLTGVGSSSTSIADMNGDGNPDLLITGSGENAPSATLYLGNGQGGFEESQAGLAGAGRGSSTSIGDVNGDGNPDLLITGLDQHTNPTATLYLGNGQGGFEEAGASLTGVRSSSTSIADVDGDGNQDLLIAGVDENQNPTTTLYLGDGQGDFAKAEVGLPKVEGGSTSIADVSGDGAKDLLVTGFSSTSQSRTATLYENLFDDPLSNDQVPPDAPTGVAATPSSSAVSLSWAGSGSADVNRYRIYRSTAPIGSATGHSSPVPLDSTGAATTAYTDTTAEVGEAYRYRVTAVDTAGNESALSGVAAAYLQPEAVEASVARTFGEASGPGDYRLVALPGAPDTSLAASISGEAGAEWQAYREAGDDLRRYQGSAEEEFSFRKGRGYWLTSRQEWTLEGSIESASLQDSTTAIPLNPGGWTIVANPFGEAVSFSALNRANGGDLEALWPFGGAFSDTSATFKSAREGQAYYLFSEDPSRDSLQVPHPALTDGSGEASSQKRALEAASGKAASAKAAAPATIALSARPVGAGEGGPGAASTVRVGLAGERGPGTLRAPPGGLEAVSLRVVRGGQEKGGQGEKKRLLMADRRRAEGEGETFRLRLESQVEGPIQVQARGADSLGSRSAALIDRSEKTTYDLSRDGPIQITPGQEKRRLEVAVGTENYVEGKREEAMPEKVRLTSYPNPAGRRATIEYALPEAREVTLQVYDVLGRRVATLEQGRKEAGRHTARLETGRLSSGVYFGRLEAGEQTRTQKITVVR